MVDFFLVSKCVDFDSDLPELFTNSWIFCAAILQHFRAKNLSLRTGSTAVNTGQNLRG